MEIHNDVSRLNPQSRLNQDEIGRFEEEKMEFYKEIQDKTIKNTNYPVGFIKQTSALKLMFL